jgi:undecaprenyl phosphate N,N'-diacetylbacillosamine 1-phosphate transferase
MIINRLKYFSKNNLVKSKLLKEIFDRCAAAILLLLLLAIFIIISICIRLDSKGPIFFIQNRVGKDKKNFKIYKFRTMVKDAEKMDKFDLESNDKRITRVGKIIREWSIDELPQLINILKGDMSFIGPRPTLLYQVEKYDQFQLRRLEFKPGLTGWAQVNGRNALSWDEKIKLDIYYVDHWSLKLDLKILLLTIKVVLRKENLYETKHNTHSKNSNKNSKKNAVIKN